MGFPICGLGAALGGSSLFLLLLLSRDGPSQETPYRAIQAVPEGWGQGICGDEYAASGSDHHAQEEWTHGVAYLLYLVFSDLALFLIQLGRSR